MASLRSLLDVLRSNLSALWVAIGYYLIVDKLIETVEILCYDVDSHVHLRVL